MVDFGVASFIIFVIAIISILYLKRKQIEFQGIFAIARTKKLRAEIYNVGKNHPKFWKYFFSLGIMVGIFTMIIGSYFIASSTLDSLSGSSTPAIGLVIPYPTSEISYQPGLLKVPAWIWIIAIPFLLIPHELAHGLALAYNKLRIKSLGLLTFLLIIPGAFVEPDEKQLKKAPKKQKLQVYCAGSFANLIMGLLFIILLHAVLSVFYMPIGVNFFLPGDDINRSALISNTTLENGLIELKTINSTYIITPQMLMEQQNKTAIRMLEDLPAARNNMSGTLEKIGETEIKDYNDVSVALSKFKPGEIVEIRTTQGVFNVKLADNGGKAYLGIFFPKVGEFTKILSPTAYRIYEAKDKNLEALTGQIMLLINFIILVCLGVALFNMLPMKPFDGGLVIEELTSPMIANISTVIMLLALLTSLALAIF